MEPTAQQSIRDILVQLENYIIEAIPNHYQTPEEYQKTILDHFESLHGSYDLLEDYLSLIYFMPTNWELFYRIAEIYREKGLINIAKSYYRLSIIFGGSLKTFIGLSKCYPNDYILKTTPATTAKKYIINAGIVATKALPQPLSGIVAVPQPPS